MTDDDGVRALLPGCAGFLEMYEALLIQLHLTVGTGMSFKPSFGTETVIVPAPGAPLCRLARRVGSARSPVRPSPRSFLAFSTSVGRSFTEVVSLCG